VNLKTGLILVRTDGLGTFRGRMFVVNMGPEKVGHWIAKAGRCLAIHSSISDKLAKSKWIKLDLLRLVTCHVNITASKPFYGLAWFSRRVRYMVKRGRYIRLLVCT
jgi:hypothetical protein